MAKRFAPNSAEARDVAYHLHSYTNPDLLKQNGPQIMTSGDGIYITDHDGKRFIEGMSGLWCASLGFSETELIKTATEQMHKLPYYHSFGGKTAEPAVALAEALIQIAPDGIEKVFFCNSGSEANDTAIKMVWYYHTAMGNPKKKKIISRQNSYHGVTLAAASLTALNYAHEGFGLPLDFARHTAFPYYFQHAKDGETERQFSTRLAEELEAMIAEEGADTIGGFIAEPLMGAGGVIPPPEGYFELIQPILKKHDILLIADEVICGFGRTGNMWGAETYGLSPDILTCAKGLSAAYLPIAAVMASVEVIAAVEEQANRLGFFGHGYTYSAHPVASAVALRVIELMQERKILDHIRDVAPHFAERIHRLDAYNCVGDTRAVGLIGAIDFVRQKGSRLKHDSEAKFAPQVVALAHEQGVILRGLPNDALGFCPPLIITHEQIDEMFDAVEAMMPKADALSKSLA